MKFESIYISSCEQVLAYVLRRANREDALDVVAETWLVAWRRLPDIPKNNLPWLLGVASKVLANQRRSDNRRQELRHRLSFPAAAEKTLKDHANTVAMRAEIMEVLAKLSSADREALLLVAWDGLDPREAAAVMGYTTAAFSVRLHRARKRFIKRLELAEHESRKSLKLAVLRSPDEV